MIKWLHHLFSPHCPECKEEREESNHCESCDTLRMQLQLSNDEKTRLMNMLLSKPEIPIVNKPPEITRPSLIPWNVRRQMLEQEDREKARILRESPKPNPNTNIQNPNQMNQTTDELEKELGFAESNRESEKG